MFYDACDKLADVTLLEAFELLRRRTSSADSLRALRPAPSVTVNRKLLFNSTQPADAVLKLSGR